MIFVALLGFMIIFTGFFVPNIPYFILFLAFDTIELYALQVSISVLIVLVSHVFILYESMLMSIGYLEELILKNSKGSEDEKVKKSLAAIVEDYVELKEYMSIFNEVFSLVYLVEFLTMIMIIATFLTELSIHPELLGDIISLIVCLFTIFYSCLFGSLLEVKHDKYCNALYGLSWTDLPVGQQKLILMMLTAAKQRSIIECGVWEYNLEMLISICQSGYSYFNILLTLRRNV
jgi:7tm Odorant receptor